MYWFTSRGPGVGEREEDRVGYFRLGSVIWWRCGREWLRQVPFFCHGGSAGDEIVACLPLDASGCRCEYVDGRLDGSGVRCARVSASVEEVL